MLPEQRKKILTIFLFIYLAFSIIIVYLFLFVGGLEIQEEFNEDEGEKEIYLVNTTDRVIHNVSVKYKEGNFEIDFNTFRFLAPQEKILLHLNELNRNQVTLVISAPYHSTIEKLIAIRAKGETTIKANFPSDILFGKTFRVSLDICNKSKKEQQFTVEEEHENGFFSEPPQKDILNLGPDECGKTQYALLPTQKGETTIYFNVSSSNTNERLLQVIMVE
ncbi:MAG: hypothetical protein CL944_02605 [Candidatus Diapherotrites archaeon]|uniref:Uncharacterized protein n=1 Tax=Candidatus Iainarchaeum sp. TaxID=3101447 RepID=A0A2D6LQF3_9ARCH|nr:hypothetical protein [Candidatus Diapherotrites archaeon]|tara:strand:- start:590 stop:1249 length:660 start_codon:yes stop_codon:yes gene_type:complete